MHPRTIAAIAAGKLAGAASRALGRGGGTSVAGLVAERIDPGIVRTLAARAGHGAIAVTGTNGKTTTSLMLNRIAAEAGLRPLHNRSGSNLMRGVAAAFVREASLTGAIADAARRLAILEVDEATLPYIVPAVRPRAIVFTNLFRDQLDRYGEVDTVAQAWGRALERAPAGTTLVLNADDPAVAFLGRSTPGPVLYYGIDDASAAVAGDEHASDFRTCLRCGAELRYDLTYYGHIGHWRCDACGNARPAPDVRITSIAPASTSNSQPPTTSPAPGVRATRIRIESARGDLCIALPLEGTYNAYNALAAAAGALALGIALEPIVRALDGFSAAFGRQETFHIDGREVRVLLGKNPTGVNQVLRAIAAAPGQKRLVFALNDGIADGRDVSWIWDADYETARPDAEYVLASGTRAEDLALRLKYAGFGDDPPIERDVRAAADRAIAAAPPGAVLHIVPTYTAMLDVREHRARRDGRARRYWEGG
jgi:UDP-N-acetylmuramyl tripeptide synthase